MTMKRLLFILSAVLLAASLSYGQSDTTNHPHHDVDDFLFDTEGLDDEDEDMGGYIPDAMRSSNDVFSSNAAMTAINKSEEENYLFPDGTVGKEPAHHESRHLCP